MAQRSSRATEQIYSPVLTDHRESAITSFSSSQALCIPQRTLTAARRLYGFVTQYSVIGRKQSFKGRGRGRTAKSARALRVGNRSRFAGQSRQWLLSANSRAREHLSAIDGQTLQDDLQVLFKEAFR